jgi:hypothetical protein
VENASPSYEAAPVRDPGDPPCMWLYFRLPLSFREVQELMLLWIFAHHPPGPPPHPASPPTPLIAPPRRTGENDRQTQAHTPPHAAAAENPPHTLHLALTGTDSSRSECTPSTLARVARRLRQPLLH